MTGLFLIQNIVFTKSKTLVLLKSKHWFYCMQHKVVCKWSYYCWKIHTYLNSMSLTGLAGMAVTWSAGHFFHHARASSSFNGRCQVCASIQQNFAFKSLKGGGVRCLRTKVCSNFKFTAAEPESQATFHFKWKWSSLSNRRKTWIDNLTLRLLQCNSASSCVSYKMHPIPL